MNNLTKACKSLSLALTYAEDGAVVAAIEICTEAMTLLYRERDRRLQAGLIQRPAFSSIANTPTSNKMVTGPETFRAPRRHSAETRAKMKATAKRGKP
jgi:hypothetical protein